MILLGFRYLLIRKKSNIFKNYILLDATMMLASHLDTNSINMSLIEVKVLRKIKSCKIKYK